jgi:phosphoesterase RecJ-like protein
MNNMLEKIISSETLDRILSTINNGTNFVILSHKNPDGDALGSSLALYYYLRSLGKKVSVVLPNQFPDFLSWLPSAGDVLLYEGAEVYVRKVVQAADAFFCLDFNTLSRIGDVGACVDACDAPKVLIDHHPFPSDDFSIAVSCPEACSTSELVYRVIVGISGTDAVSFDIAQCVYTGMMTDTGAFAYASARKDIYLIIADLLSKGIDKDAIYRKVFFTSSLTRMRLWGYVMYEKLQYFKKYNAALITISNSELMRFYAKKGDTEGLVNQPLQINGVRFSCFFREEIPGKINVSLRSVDDFPCNKVAAEYFNGGGHLNASGGELHCSMDEAVKIFGEVLRRYKDELA